jgi:hypothetical protein
VALPTVLLSDLLRLSGSLGSDEDALAASLDSLVDGLRAAVPSYRGLHLTIVDNGYPVTLTAFVPLQDGDSINTSLRVRLAARGPGFHGASQIVFYASTPGAFVDMAADFGYAIGAPIITASSPTRADDKADGDGQHRPTGTGGDGLRAGEQRDGGGHQAVAGGDGHGLIVLDADLPPPPKRSRLVGLEERSLIDRAVGFMIDKGHPPDDAFATLRRLAAAAGVEPHIYAARLLRG